MKESAESIDPFGGQQLERVGEGRLAGVQGAGLNDREIGKSVFIDLVESGDKLQGVALGVQLGCEELTHLIPESLRIQPKDVAVL